MKNYFSLGLSALILLASCNNDNEAVGTDSNKTLIRLGTVMQTKAPVNDASGLNTAGIGIFGITTKKTVAGDAVTDWTAAKILDNVKPQSVESDGSIVLPIPYYYPEDAADYVKFMAFHPYAATGTTGDNYLHVTDAAAPELNFTLTGKEDLMYATPAIGNNATTVAQELAFKHSLTQITFDVIKDAAMTGDLSVTGIQFAGVNTTGKMNIETGAISDWGTPGDLTAFNSVSDGGAVEIPASGATPVVAGSPVMLQGGQEKFALNIATTAKTFQGVEILPTSPATAFEVGKSYKVTITFNVGNVTPGQEIKLSASVQPWEDGGTGSGSVTE